MKNRATAIILRNGKLLLLHRQKPGRDYYILPGGGVELDESFEEACIREVKEETGLDIKVNKVVSVYLINTDPRGNSIDIVYTGNITGGKFGLSEHNQYEFFSLKGLPKLIAYKHREVITNWFKNK